MTKFLFATLIPIVLTTQADLANASDCKSNNGLAALNSCIASSLPQACREFQETTFRLKSTDGFILGGSREEKQLASAYNNCNQYLYNKCYSQNKNIISLHNLTKKFESWKKHPEYRMDRPHGLCTERARLLSQELADQNISSRVMYLKSVAITALNRGKGSGVYTYGGHFRMQSEKSVAFGTGFHAVPIVRARDDNGRVADFVIDPQFADAPIERSEYIKSVTGQDCVNADRASSPIECFWEDKSPTDLYLAGDPVAGLLESVSEIQKCGWSLRSYAQKTIRHTQSLEHERHPPTNCPTPKWLYDCEQTRKDVLAKHRLVLSEIRATECETDSRGSWKCPLVGNGRN